MGPDSGESGYVSIEDVEGGKDVEDATDLIVATVGPDSGESGYVSIEDVEGGKDVEDVEDVTHLIPASSQRFLAGPILADSGRRVSIAERSTTIIAVKLAVGVI